MRLHVPSVSVPVPDVVPVSVFSSASLAVCLAVLSVCASLSVVEAARAAEAAELNIRAVALSIPTTGTIMTTIVPWQEVFLVYVSVLA